MARAHTIWIVVDELGGVPLAAFTVKHELVTWAERHPNILADCRIFSVPDGHSERTIKEISLGEIIGK